MLSILIENSPREQWLSGVFLLLAGLVIFPALIALLMPLARWMNGFWIESDAGQWVLTGTRIFLALGCGTLALAGLGRLAVYSFAQSGLIANPWQ
jgi:hypothetical protein